MKRIVTFWLCMMYTFVSLGGSIFMHNCGEQTILSIYEKASHEVCPICSDNDSERSTCTNGSCKDIEIKIDQLSKEPFSANKAEKTALQPCILTRLWVELKPVSKIVTTNTFCNSDRLLYTNIDPPSYILHCNFRN